MLVNCDDPHDALGPDIFIEILYHLSAPDILAVEQVCRAWQATARPRSTGLWRHACLVAGVEPADIRTCDALAAQGTWTVDEFDRRPLAIKISHLLDSEERERRRSNEIDRMEVEREMATSTPETDYTRVNWRYVCQAHFDLQKAWRNARCRLRWITPTDNSVWRIKTVLENDILISTSWVGGVTTVDRLTSKPIFSIEGVSSHAHLEAGRGFIAFNRHGNDSAMEVWRSGEARARSTLPRLGVSSIGHTAMSHTHDHTFVPEVPDTPLPRGHLEHFRTLEPPAHALAFRLHVDGADTDNERAVLAAAGSTAVFIWHLEEEREMDKIDRIEEDVGDANYIELDDDYLFVCLDRQMHVYSRRTRKHVVSFPPIRTPPRDVAALAFPLSLRESFGAIPDEERSRVNPERTADGVPADVARAVVTGALRGEPGFDDAVAQAVAAHSPRLKVDRVEDVVYTFTACHFTSTHLICTAKTGAVFVVPDYKRVLAEVLDMPPADRAAHVAHNTILIGLSTPIRQLTTYRDHIAMCTSFNVIIFDGTHFPTIPRAPFPAPVPGLASARPTLRAHVLLGNHPQGIKMSSCIQADARSLYLVYAAGREAAATGGNNDSPNAPPPDATTGFGLAVKVWTFGLE